MEKLHGKGRVIVFQGPDECFIIEASYLDLTRDLHYIKSDRKLVSLPIIHQQGISLKDIAEEFVNYLYTNHPNIETEAIVDYQFDFSIDFVQNSYHWGFELEEQTMFQFIVTKQYTITEDIKAIHEYLEVENASDSSQLY